MSRPPTRTVPSCGSANRSSSEASVVFPAPEGPTIATVSPGATAKLTPSIAGASPGR